MKYALRSLAKSPGFSAVALLTLALAIGVNTATYSFVRDLFLRPLVRDQRANLVSLYTSRADTQRDFRRFSYQEFLTLRNSREAFSDVTAMAFATVALGRSDHLKRSFVCLVAENYFDLLGAQPLQGRFFSREETRPNAALPVVVASHAYWQRLGRPADFLGSQLSINGRDFTVVGLAPEGFGGLHSSITPAVWLPLGAAPLFSDHLWGSGSTDLLREDSHRLHLVGSFQLGLTLETATQRIALIDTRLNAHATLSGPGSARQLVIAPPSRMSLGNVEPADEHQLATIAALVLGMPLIVLLVACLNLANLLLARGTARQREIAIRLALGASRWQVVRQLLLEGLVLALGGGVLGLLLSWWLGDLLLHSTAEKFGASVFTLNTYPPIDASSLAVTFGLCVAATLVFSLGPALRAIRVNLIDDLKSQPGEPAARDAWNRFFSLRHCLVMSQIALALMLLFGAALFVRGSRNATRLDPGFATHGRLVANVDYTFGATAKDDIPGRQKALLAHAATLPGVSHAALSSAVPYNFEQNYWPIFGVGAATPDTARSAAYTSVSHGYFDALGIRLLRGRDFSATESSGGGPPVAIIDESLARSLFGDADPLGRHISPSTGGTDHRPSNRVLEVIGIVRSPRDDIFGEHPPRRVYYPLGQHPIRNTYLHVTFASPTHASAAVAQLRRELVTLDPENPPLFVRRLGDFVDQNINLGLIRIAAIAFSAFGGVALLLALVGVYGVKAHAVARRTREIGIRMALGAQRGHVLALVLRQGALQTTIGIAAGLVLALLAGQALSKMLYRVNPFDPLSLAAAAILLATATLLACYLPARRATRVDPIAALRTE